MSPNFLPSFLTPFVPYPVAWSSMPATTHTTYHPPCPSFGIPGSWVDSFRLPHLCHCLCLPFPTCLQPPSLALTSLSHVCMMNFGGWEGGDMEGRMGMWRGRGTGGEEGGWEGVGTMPPSLPSLPACCPTALIQLPACTLPHYLPNIFTHETLFFTHCTTLPTYPFLVLPT